MDETYRFTGEHLSLYDRTKAEAHDIAHGHLLAMEPRRRCETVDALRR